MFVGAFAFSFAVYSLLTYTKASPKRLQLAPTSPRVAQSDQNSFTNSVTYEGEIDISQLVHGASVFIWGLILAKARSGLEAVGTKDTA